MSPTRAVLFLNGDLEHHSVVATELRADDFILCADGGVLHAQKMSIVPHVVIGDFDSTPPEILQKLESHTETELVRCSPDKDQTDLELCLEYIEKRGFSNLLIIGAFGGELDHFLANILAVVHGAGSFSSCEFFDGSARAFFLQGPAERSFLSAQGKRLSLLPLSPMVSGVSLGGVRWGLDSEDLQIGKSRTLRNEITASEAHIKLESGRLLVVQLSRPLSCL